jgi:hypothetical protein
MGNVGHLSKGSSGFDQVDNLNPVNEEMSIHVKE